MKYTEFFKPFRTLYARITMWIMLTVLVVFIIITYLVTYFGARGVLLGSTENAKSRMEITNQLNGEVIRLQAPAPIYGTLVVESTPDMATLYIDGKEYDAAAAIGGEDKVVVKVYFYGTIEDYLNALLDLSVKYGIDRVKEDTETPDETENEKK